MCEPTIDEIALRFAVELLDLCMPDGRQGPYLDRWIMGRAYELAYAFVEARDKRMTHRTGEEKGAGRLK